MNVVIVVEVDPNTSQIVNMQPFATPKDAAAAIRLYPWASSFATTVERMLGKGKDSYQTGFQKTSPDGSIRIDVGFFEVEGSNVDDPFANVRTGVMA